MTRKRGLLAVALFCIVVLTTSCTNLAAVREWSKTSLDATQYQGIVNTYADTPQRLKKYDPKGPWDAQTDIRKKQADGLRQILSVITDYMAVLATLSADGTVDYTKNVDSLTSEIGKLNPTISKDTLNAVGSLAKTVLGAAANAYQANGVKKVVEEANAPLQRLLRGQLRQVVDRDFRRDLEDERLLIDGYYNSLERSGKPSPAAIAAVEEWKEVRLAENDKRMNAVDAYLKVLDKVAEGHQKLYDNRNQLDAKTLIKDLYSMTIDLQKQIKILAKS